MERCEYEQGNVSDGRLSDLDSWSCDRETHRGEDYCLFHLPKEKKDDKEVARQLLNTINGADDEQRSFGEVSDRNRFIGAKFGTLNLKYTILDPDNNLPIDLRDATIDGELDFSETVVENPVWLSGSDVRGEAEFRGATFRSDQRFVGTTFEKRTYWMGVTFETFTEFNQARFREKADFRKATFQGDSRFIGVIFEGDLDCNSVRFKQDAVFQGSIFNGTTEFRNAQFGDTANFRDTVFTPTGRFEGSHFQGRVLFSPNENGPDFGIVNLGGCSVNQGSLGQSNQSKFLYDIAHGQLGDVELEANDLEEPLFEYYRFFQTIFDGFDFIEHNEDLIAKEWNIHTVESLDKSVDTDVSEDQRSVVDTQASDLAATYLKAKNGATQVGDTRAASEFFQKELRYRRKKYLEIARDSSEPFEKRVRNFGKGTANALFDYTAGYGERPSRVIGFAVLIVLLFSLVFALAMGTTPYDVNYGYLILSIESFVTLVLGGSEKIQHPGIRLLAEFEGFLGVFTVGLFVFTLTRSVHR